MPERLLQSPIVFWKIDRKIPPFPAPWITWIPMFFTQGMVIRYTGRPNKINMLRHSHIQFVGCTSYIYISHINPITSPQQVVLLPHVR
jgi:hypothetical protein